MTIMAPDISGTAPSRVAERRLQIYMLRHGKPQFPDERSYVYGWTDYPLSPLGREQAKHIGAALSSIRFDRIISSDLSRAAETADIVAASQAPPIREVERDPELREINMGEWDGKTVSEIRENYVDIFRERGLDLANVAAPGGETFVRLRERGMKAFERITRSSEASSKILIVAHGAYMWSIISGIFGIELGDIFRFGLDHCAVHLVEYRPMPTQWGNYRLIRYNWLPDLAAYSDDLV
ncbi:MAG: histidine phosphatase family protein [Synergistaceae bacterium]|nr:histidine phosphatase family protein [Synergistaceae bacterium]